MIKEQEAGLLTAELCRKHGQSDSTFFFKQTKPRGRYKKAQDSAVAPMITALGPVTL